MNIKSHFLIISEDENKNTIIPFNKINFIQAIKDEKNINQLKIVIGLTNGTYNDKWLEEDYDKYIKDYFNWLNNQEK